MMAPVLDRSADWLLDTVQFAQCVVAQYVPDLRRSESRNIGVFVWMPGVIRSKFLSPADASAFVGNLDTYNRWVQFWSERISAAEFVHKGTSTPKTAAHYLDALIATQKKCYQLRLANELLSETEPSKLDQAVQRLFDELVVPQTRRPMFDEPPSVRYVLN